MIKEYTETLAEVSEVLKNMDEKDVNKIPKNILDYINENKSKEYDFKIIPNIPFSEQKLKKETLALLAMFSLNYWCKNQDEKEELFLKFKENEMKEEEAKREKYNPDDLFKNREEKKINIADSDKNENKTDDEIESEADEIKENENQKALVKYKEPNIFMKIINKIKKLLKKD